MPFDIQITYVDGSYGFESFDLSHILFSWLTFLSFEEKMRGQKLVGHWKILSFVAKINKTHPLLEMEQFPLFFFFWLNFSIFSFPKFWEYKHDIVTFSVVQISFIHLNFSNEDDAFPPLQLMKQ